MIKKVTESLKSTGARLAFFIFVVGVALFVSRGSCSPSSGIVLTDYNLARDYDQLIALFERNRYWLTTDPNSPTEYIFTHLSPRPDSRYHGQMTVKILRSNGDLAGFVSYYMKRNDVGFILYLGIDERYRGKHLADRLMKHAMDDLLSRGAKRIELITRPTNISAQTVYNRLGFRERGRDNVYVFYEYLP